MNVKWLRKNSQFLTTLPIFITFILISINLGLLKFSDNNHLRKPGDYRQWYLTPEHRSESVSENCRKVMYRNKLLEVPKAGKNCSIVQCPIFVHNNPDFIVCDVNSVGSSNLNHGLLHLLKKEKKSMSKFKNNLSKTHITPHLIEENEPVRISPSYYNNRQLSTFYKYMFVRHPFTRLVSFFDDNMHEDGMRKDIFIPLIKKSRNLKYVGDDVMPTFKEFVTYLINTDVTKYDRHFMPYSLMCQPCNVNYDFIGRMETCFRDRDHIYDKLNVRYDKNSPSCIQQSTSKNKWEAYFTQLTRQEIQELYKIYFYDFEIFDYTPELFLTLGSE